MNREDFLHIIFKEEELKTLMQHPVIVALSGGADSVALLRVLLEAGCDCHAAHCNFHLRGEESMRDERFVRELCDKLNVPLSVKDFDVPTFQLEHGGSVEMACRTLRYTWFELELKRLECSVIAVAHHADDQIETFFLNLMRGTGIKGLAGMERLNGNIWRPLLEVTRQDILDYLKTIGQNYVTDSTNAVNDYRRNQLRNIVLPAIEQQFPQARLRILDTMSNLSCDHELLRSLVQDTIPDERNIDIKQLCHSDFADTLLYHRIRHLGFNRDQCVQAIEAARRGHSGRQFKGEGHVMTINRQTLSIAPIIDNPKQQEIPLDLHQGLQSPIQLDILHNNAPFSPLMCDGKNKVVFNTEILNCQRIVLRHWKRGDRIRPFGMNGSKLVSDLFADFKLDHAAKQSTWLLEADGIILWVLGYRASSDFPVAKESQDYLIFKI